MEEKTAPTPTGTTDDTKTIVTVLLLIFFFPIGFIMMWVWTHWPTWVKLLISAIVGLYMLFIFIIVGFFFTVFIAAMLAPSKEDNTDKQLPKVQQLTPTASPIPSIDSSKWKTLNDSDGARVAELGAPTLKYSFKYPSAFEVSPASGVNSHSLKASFQSTDGTPIQFDVYTYLLSGDTYVMPQILEKTQTYLGGKNATRQYGVDRNPEGPTIAYTVADKAWTNAGKKWGFLFRCTFSKTPSNDLIQLCDHIASTFTFVK